MADPTPDTKRPTRKRNESKRGGAGAPAAIETEVSVASGREYQMGRSPLSMRNDEWQYYNVDEVIRRYGGMTEYRKMLSDDAVKAALAFKKILVYGRDYNIDPGTDDDKGKDIAAFVEWNLQRANIKKIVKEALTAFEYGFSFGEILWELTTYKGKRCIALKGVKMRRPEDCTIYIDKHGNVTRVEQDDSFGVCIDIPLHKVFHYAHQGELGNVYGTSDLRAVYKNWWAKKYLVNFWNVYLERLGAPTLLMKYPQGASSQLQGTLKGILKDLGNRAEMLVPAGVEVDVLESTRAGQATYAEALAYHDMAIARGVLVPALMGLGDTGSRGSDSQSALQLRTMFKIADEIGNEITAIIHQQIIKQLVDFNYDVEDEYPEMCWQDYGEFQATDIADTIRLLHNAGIIDMDQEDVNYARAILGLPQRDADDEPDEVIRPAAAPMGTGANPPTTPSAGGAGQGNETGKIGAQGGAGARENKPTRAAELEAVLTRLSEVEDRVLSRKRKVRKTIGRDAQGEIASITEEEID